ncbi:MAG: helix-turn-helix domain-containing protein [Chloroflexi bacterium]|nr:helix-turn-helix domain-containing protein [Chloroflexota bacterium]
MVEKRSIIETLLSIREASQILGVSEVTLRQWTDEGKIKAFITPGGHRRYSRTELRKLLSSQTKMHGIKDLVSELEGSVDVHREISRKAIEHTSWYGQLTPESQEQLGQLGRGILNLIIRYINDPSRREATIELTRGVGHDLGKMLAELGLPLTTSVEAFILHRDPIINAATQLMKKREGFTGRVVEAIPMVAHIMDEALVSLVAAHQQNRKEINGDSKGGTR